MKKEREERPKISDQFADLKGHLAGVSQSEWEAIPDVGDYSLKYKQSKRREIFTPMPDHVIEGARNDAAVVGTMDPALGGATPGTSTTNISSLGHARGTVLGLKLDKMSDSVTGQTAVNPKGYLTDLNSLKISSDAEVGDIEKARLLLKSVTSTNPKHGPGWIAAARVEEFAGKIVQARISLLAGWDARKTIKAGCEACPDNEDVWLEGARLQTPENAKTVLANAIRNLPTSVKIWLRAAELETTNASKKVVLRRALEFVPNSVKLWKTAIELEGVEDALIMLGRAVECVPHSVDMWLALARLETYENAQKVLNRAREAIPTEPAIWITASKLEEAQGKPHMVDKIIEMAISSLRQFQAREPTLGHDRLHVVIDREQWIKEAEEAEQADAPLTCGAIVRATVHIGVEEEDRKRTWMDDAENSLNRGGVETARAIYAHALGHFRSKKGVWMRACALEKKHGTAESLEQARAPSWMLKKAVTHCPRAEMLWLMAAKEKWLSNDVDGARTILKEAFLANPDSEQVWLAAVKLEWENNAFERARILLKKACDRAPTALVWMKAALLERELKAPEAALKLIDTALPSYPTFAKLYMMAGQLCSEELNLPERAREYYQRGLRACPGSIPLWRLAARLEERTVGVNKARPMLEVARLRNPKSEGLWLEAVRLERRAGNNKGADSLMAKALQECPGSGVLWAEEILVAQRAEQKSKSLEALKRCDNDPHVITAVARRFWADRKYAKARKWFNRAITLDPNMGDAWAAYYAFELQQGTEVEQKDVLDRCVAAEPAHGELWTSVSKTTENRRLDKASILKKVVAAYFSDGAVVVIPGGPTSTS
ncbi:unnamed protein product [Ectocarpus sp. 6 AP-2014]